MKKENTRNQEELVLEDALTQIIFNEKEEQDMVEDDNAEEIDRHNRNPSSFWNRHPHHRPRYLLLLHSPRRQFLPHDKRKL